MTHVTPLMRKAFTADRPLYVRITPTGFRIDDRPLHELRGRISNLRLRRRRFDADGTVDCESPDGLVARDGTKCELCRHPRCRPFLRLHLRDDNSTYVLDLGGSSARNLIAMEAEAHASGSELEDWTLLLTVLDRQDWAEVAFERI